ncbi:cytochrome P450 [Xylaria bambusicola]|uniref:cytochrome P450 n=1 Tax=Xylaria bambusicola TaxID=326684 RepID=UPI002008486F|nr:cytochrome P450 [Xylaria bambusicola]KAI0516988.1 cytochrome P450 [Xylaria bambusicola]
MLNTNYTYAYVNQPVRQCLAVASYRLLLHPLCSYPGPFLAKITQAYAGYYVVRKRDHLEVYEHHNQYGPVVRVGPNRLCFNTVTAFRDIYQNERITKASGYTAGALNNAPNLFYIIDNKPHRHKRNIMAQALSDRSLHTFEPVILDKLDTTLRQILHASRTSTPTDMTEKLRQLGLDIVGRLAFGYDLDVQTKQENRPMIDGMSFGNFRFNVYLNIPCLAAACLRIIEKLVGVGPRKKFFARVKKMIVSRMAQDKDAQHDLYSIAADAYGDLSPGSGFWNDALLFIAAGGDTTSSAVCSTLFYLTHYPDCYQSLAQEIRSTFRSGREIKTGSQLASCQYLRACIDESLRMSPPIVTTTWREQIRGTNVSEPLIVDGHVIPPGTFVGVNLYALHHNEEYFPDSFTYKPERWIKVDTGAPGETPKQSHRAAFAPFSAGSRSCLGKSMAYLELSLVVAKIMWYFDFERAPGKLGEIGGGTVGATNGRGRPDEYQVDDIFISQHRGPYLVFVPRGDTCMDLE